jgi:hypothetical protein
MIFCVKNAVVSPSLYKCVLLLKIAQRSFLLLVVLIRVCVVKFTPSNHLYYLFLYVELKDYIWICVMTNKVLSFYIDNLIFN